MDTHTICFCSSSWLRNTEYCREKRVYGWPFPRDRILWTEREWSCVSHCFKSPTPFLGCNLLEAEDPPSKVVLDAAWPVSEALKCVEVESFLPILPGVTSRPAATRSEIRSMAYSASVGTSLKGEGILTYRVSQWCRFAKSTPHLPSFLRTREGCDNRRYVPE